MLAPLALLVMSAAMAHSQHVDRPGPDRSSGDQAEADVADSDLPEDDPILTALKTRLEDQPDHSETWRMIGRVLRQRGKMEPALAATRQALELDPLNAAAHFDFAELSKQSGDPESALFHQRQVLKIAPHSTYAEQLIAQGIQLSSSEIDQASESWRDQWGSKFAVTQAVAENGGNESSIQPVDYQIQTLDGADDLDREIKRIDSTINFEEKKIRFWVESGYQYNSNISLTPISRELVDSDAASGQWIVSPELEWSLHRNRQWRTGPLLRGFFTVNDSTWSDFDLASFQPGAFIERDWDDGDRNRLGRVDYVYALDLVGGSRLGDRHSVTTSVIDIDADLNVNYGYITTSFSEFDDDGADPAVNSLDGFSIAGGWSRFFQTNWQRVPSWSLGVDLESANTEGASFRYWGIAFHHSSTIQLSERLSFLPTAGIGARNYFDFAGPVNRDELTWRTGGRLQYRLSEAWSVSAVANYDRFVSDNDAFDAERLVTGIVTTFRY